MGAVGGAAAGRSLVRLDVVLAGTFDTAVFEDIRQHFVEMSAATATGALRWSLREFHGIDALREVRSRGSPICSGDYIVVEEPDLEAGGAAPVLKRVLGRRVVPVREGEAPCGRVILFAVPVQFQAAPAPRQSRCGGPTGGPSPPHDPGLRIIEVRPPDDDGRFSSR